MAAKDLEARLQLLEDIQAIRDVFFKWNNHCTGGFNGKQAGRLEALECLTEDATIEVQGLHEPGEGPRGRKEYTEYWDYYYGDAGPLPYVFQTSAADKIEVSGDAAVQHLNQLAIIGFRGAKPTIGLTQRINYYRRTEAGWRIEKTTVEGGLKIRVDKITGALNAIPPADQRTPWKPGRP
jgi:hypothetical protein